MKTKISVRDAMVTSVITISPEKTVMDAAKLMKKNNIGGLVVVGNGKPVGMITERDFVDLVAKNAESSKLLIEKVMSTPVLSISPDDSILDAAKLMSKTKKRKLPVKQKGKLIGIITAEDIVKVAPREIELLLELASMKAGVSTQEFMQSSTEGECEVCGNFSDYLYQVGDSYLCSECKESTSEEK